VHRPRRREDHERVTIRMASAEVIEIDLIFTAEQRQLVFEGTLGWGTPYFYIRRPSSDVSS
jgi:hypothetical protein